MKKCKNPNIRCIVYGYDIGAKEHSFLKHLPPFHVHLSLVQLSSLNEFSHFQSSQPLPTVFTVQVGIF